MILLLSAIEGISQFVYAIRTYKPNTKEPCASMKPQAGRVICRDSKEPQSAKPSKKFDSNEQLKLR